MEQNEKEKEIKEMKDVEEEKVKEKVKKAKEKVKKAKEKKVKEKKVKGQDQKDEEEQEKMDLLEEGTSNLLKDRGEGEGRRKSKEGTKEQEAGEGGVEGVHTVLEEEDRIRDERYQ